jgi:LemA protein
MTSIGSKTKGFVTGHDFSRAEKAGEMRGFNPWGFNFIHRICFRNMRFYGGATNDMSKGLGITLVILGVLLLVVLGVFGSYVGARNQMVNKDQAVKAAWSEVDVQLERRADLIPNLVSTVKGFTKEESTVFGDIANARAGMLNAQGPAAKIAANGQLDSALGRLLLLTENYPQLRSSDQFMRLQDELSGTENRISVARKRYNDALQDYNTFVLQFPNNIWAGIAGFKQNTAYFTASPAAQQVPSVQF